MYGSIVIKYGLFGLAGYFEEVSESGMADVVA